MAVLHARRETEDGRMSKDTRGWWALALALMLSGATAASAAPDTAATGVVCRLDTLLGRADLWMLAAGDFGAAVPDGKFRWLDKQHSAAQGGRAVELRFLDLRIWDALVSFESNHIGRLELFFYNRGDAGDLNAKAFNGLLDKISAGLSNWTGVAAAALPDLSGAARTKIQHVAWVKPPTRLELEWSVTKPHVQNGKQIEYRSEFIRLRVFPSAAAVTNNPPARLLPSHPTAASTAAELKTHIRSTDSGDVFLGDVPMVDQGEKGYCAAAVTERVMRYYGLDFDQHQAAQVAGTSARGGTKGDSLRDAFKRISQKNGLRFMLLEDELEGRTIQRLITAYNHAAMLAHKSKVSLDGANHELDALLSAMDPELLHQARTKTQSDLNRLKGDVVKNIDIGIPLIWDVYLGLVKEQFVTPQMHGGHLRMIIGYNKKTDEILYSDSWGAGHELKRLSLGDALTMTFGLYIVKPNSL